MTMVSVSKATVWKRYIATTIACWMDLIKVQYDFNTGMSSDEDLPRISFGSFPSSQSERKCKNEPGQSTPGPGPSRTPPVRNPRLPTSNCGEPLSNWIGVFGYSSGTRRSSTLRDPRLSIRSGLSTNIVNGMSNQWGGRCLYVLALGDLFDMSAHQSSRGSHVGNPSTAWQVVQYW